MLRAILNLRGTLAKNKEEKKSEARMLYVKLPL
jgi:hypothetical protein